MVIEKRYLEYTHVTVQFECGDVKRMLPVLRSVRIVPEVIRWNQIPRPLTPSSFKNPEQEV